MPIRELILDYLTAVERCLALFEKKFGRKDLIRAWREGVIPQTGKLADGVLYQIHGFGCGVEYTDHDIDFEFANQHEVGFDAWRLWRYAKQFSHLYPDYQDLRAVETTLAKELANGSIRRIESRYLGEGNDKLYHLAQNTEELRSGS
ncbi:DUF6896 domain-containing protein [Aestuariivirga sp.]|uniref:DUF6896 domain-containing protein n=1 Tax=Aestuariivirga sp. TaxID=2650926 RepID=UPI003BADAB5A